MPALRWDWRRYEEYRKFMGEDVSDDDEKLKTLWAFGHWKRIQETGDRVADEDAYELGHTIRLALDRIAALEAENKTLTYTLDMCRAALEKVAGAEPLVGYAFDANHQHESLIEEMKLRRQCASEALKGKGEP